MFTNENEYSKGKAHLFYAHFFKVVVIGIGCIFSIIFA